MLAINNVDNLRYRILDGNVIDYSAIHASATFSRKDKTYGFSFVKFHSNLTQFLANISEEKKLIFPCLSTSDT